MRLFILAHRRILADLTCMYNIMHDLLDFPCDTILLPPPTLGFVVILLRFTISGAKPVAANMRSAFE